MNKTKSAKIWKRRVETEPQEETGTNWKILEGGVIKNYEVRNPLNISTSLNFLYFYIHAGFRLNELQQSSAIQHESLLLFLNT
jgi:hypothetical protein